MPAAAEKICDEDVSVDRSGSGRLDAIFVVVVVMGKAFGWGIDVNQGAAELRFSETLYCLLGY